MTDSLALVVGLVTAGLTVRWVQLRGIGTDAGDFDTVAPAGSEASSDPCAGGPCNYLLLGSDSRAGLSPEQQQRFATDESLGGANRADTIILVHTNPRLQKAIVLSFPRDLWVAIPGRSHDRINTAFEGGLRHGGPKLVAQTVANLTGLQIDHYLYVDLEWFRRTVNTLGGVDMCIPAYNVNTPGDLTGTGPNGEPVLVHDDEVGHIADRDSGLNIKPRCQRLKRRPGLSYVRARPCRAITSLTSPGSGASSSSSVPS